MHHHPHFQEYFHRCHSYCPHQENTSDKKSKLLMKAESMTEVVQIQVPKA